MNWPLFFSTFPMIFIAELPDKTALGVLLMSAQGEPFAIFTGVATAYLVQSVVAVSLGGLIGLLPEHWVHLGAGLLFVGFSAHTIFQKEEMKTDSTPSKGSFNRTSFLRMATKAFMVIFIAEWGDLTQLATASIAAHYHDSLFTVFISATLALWSATALLIFVGQRLGKLVTGIWLRRVSSGVFLSFGFYFLAKGWVGLK
jgi:putative Ca2+/H+ antiporter (TMEM165/GDT1 family)